MNLRNLSHLMQWRTDFRDSCRSFRWFAQVVSIFYKGAVARIQIFDIFQAHQNFQHVSHPNGSFRRSIQKTTTCLEKIASNINVVMSEII